MTTYKEELRLKIRKAQESFQLTAGNFPGLADRKLPCIRILEEIDLGHSIRKKLEFNAERNDWVRSYLFIPKKRDKNKAGKLPGILCLHQTNGKSGCEEPAGISGLNSLYYGLELAMRGYVTLMPDFPYFGINTTNPYDIGYKSNTMKGIWNHVRALDLMESLPEVDAERLGCIGHSLGGHNTIFLAMFDKRIKVAVSSCGICSLKEYAKTNGGNLRAWAQDKYMPIIAKDYNNEPDMMPWDFPEIVAAIAPRAVFINAPLHDTNMNYPGNKVIIDKVESYYRELGAEREFCYETPDTAHEFPDYIRQKAYNFIDSKLISQ